MMNRMLKITMSLLLFCGLASCYVQAQESSSDKVYISGQVVNEKDKIGKSKVKIYGPRLTSSALTEKGGGYDDNLDLKNQFSFEFTCKKLFYPNIDKLSKANIVLIPEKRDLQMVLFNYPIEPEDSICVTLRVGKTKEEEKVSFAGRGAIKYQCRREIEEILKLSLRIGGHINTHTEEDFRKKWQFHQKRENRVLGILDKYQDNISRKAYTLLKADAMASILSDKLITFWNYYESSNVPKNVLLKAVGYTDSDGLEDSQILYNKDDAYMTLCPAYGSYLLMYAAMELYIKKDGTPPDFQEVAEIAMGSYSGVTRECMLMLLATSYFDPAPFTDSNYQSVTNEVYDNFIDRTMTFVKTPFIRMQIEYKSRIKKGMPAYNFAFTDPSGKLVKLEDFRGKTVLMDIWGTGCTGCVILARYIKNHIKPEFGDNDDFVVISINTDKRKEQWFKSLESELYSEKGDVNLHTNGKGSSDENSKYYRVTAHPFSLLIDKNGKVASYFSKDQDPEDAKTLIRETMRVPHIVE